MVNAGYDGLLEWEYRAAASYLFRYGVLASANFDIRSGEYWERSVQFRGPAGSRIPTQVLRVEPRGSRQADSLKMLDIRAEKRFQLGGTRRLSVTLNVYNVLNANSPLGIQGEPVRNSVLSHAFRRAGSSREPSGEASRRLVGYVDEPRSHGENEDAKVLLCGRRVSRGA